MAFWWSLTASLYCDHVVALALGWCTARQHSLMILLITQLGEPFCLKNLLRNYKITSPASRVDPSIACIPLCPENAFCLLSKWRGSFGKQWARDAAALVMRTSRSLSASGCPTAGLPLPPTIFSSTIASEAQGNSFPLRSIYIKLVCSHLA